MVESYNNKIAFYEIQDIEKFLGEKINTHAWHPIVIMRLMLARFIPKNVKKILYLDGDTIVRHDLTDLFEMDMKGKTLAMSIEPQFQLICDEVKRNLGKKPYCNAGVILFDLNKWRKDNCEKKILDFLAKKRNEIFAIDQDAINIIFRDDRMILPPKYNYACCAYDQYSYDFFEKHLTLLGKYNDYVSKQDYEKSRKNPYIVHFLGFERPWEKGNRNRFKDEYYQYLSDTPWKNTSPNGDHVLKQYAWFWFNKILKPFPYIRSRISILFNKAFILKYNSGHNTHG